ncbi:Expansin-A29 [Platanthera zijinensis]|uniref:Expansin n=1 Tax=Platanthera zijinensis TaxID=2320716 RepID=A0AAP0B2Q3_9ASPA
MLLWGGSAMVQKGVFVTVTATIFCPPNLTLPKDDGGWCNPPRRHLNMTQPAWEKIGIYRGDHKTPQAPPPSSTPSTSSKLHAKHFQATMGCGFNFLDCG